MMNVFNYLAQPIKLRENEVNNPNSSVFKAKEGFDNNMKYKTIS
jgi:hypothetical protein